MRFFLEGCIFRCRAGLKEIRLVLIVVGGVEMFEFDFFVFGWFEKCVCDAFVN